MDYCWYCLKNGYYSTRGNMTTNAETVYKYLTKIKKDFSTSLEMTCKSLEMKCKSIEMTCEFKRLAHQIISLCQKICLLSSPDGIPQVLSLKHAPSHLPFFQASISEMR